MVNPLPENSPSGSEVPVLDPKRLNILMELEDDEEHSTIKAIVSQFIIDADEQIDSIDRALAENDFATVSRAAHTVKGNAATFGLYRVESVAKELEASLKKPGYGDPVELSKQLREVFSAGKEALAASLATR